MAMDAGKSCLGAMDAKLDPAYKEGIGRLHKEGFKHKGTTPSMAREGGTLHIYTPPNKGESEASVYIKEENSNPKRRHME